MDRLFIAELQGSEFTDFDAPGCTLAGVAFDDPVVDFIKEDASERATGNADKAVRAQGVVDMPVAFSGMVDNGVLRATFRAFGVFALPADRGAMLSAEGLQVDLDTGRLGMEFPGLQYAAGCLAGKTSRAEILVLKNNPLHHSNLYPDRSGNFSINNVEWENEWGAFVQ